MDKKNLLILAASLLSLAANAGEVVVKDVVVNCDKQNVCRFDVTLQHADEGWDHYANRWEVLSPKGEILATRVLHHPHVHEQPFTRSLSGVALPKTLNSVLVRGNDSVHGLGQPVVVNLP